MAPRIDIGQSSHKVDGVLRRFWVTYQRYRDMSVPHRGMRWSFFAFLCLLYLARVVSHGGFYIITYGLFIQILAQLLMLITPLYDMEEAHGGSELPTTNVKGGEQGDEFRPFVPLVQEFIVWKNMTGSVVLCIFLTMIPFLDIPVYWPILVLYAVLLLIMNMSSRIKHMWKHGYVPWSAGKPKFVPKNNT